MGNKCHPTLGMVRIFTCAGYTRRQPENPIRGFQAAFLYVRNTGYSSSPLAPAPML
nr:hypothetical protein [uncultured Kingella sp.]